MDVRFVASFSVVSAQPAEDRRLFVDTLGLPLKGDDVEAAAQELEDSGYRLIHPARTEPWDQTIARLQTPDGLLVGVCFTPWLHDG
ncbi:MAG: VOC family protein [Kineosporiaceae bacterium]